MLEVSNVKLPLDAGLPEGGALVLARGGDGDVRPVADTRMTLPTKGWV